MDRAHQTFPTRLYPHRFGGQAGPPSLAAATERQMSLPAGVFRFRLGRDAGPERMTAVEIDAELGDPFARLLLSRSVLPMSLRSLLAALDVHNAAPDGLPEQHTFLAADGGKIPWTPETDDLRREFRFIVTRGRAGQPPPNLMIAASTVVDSEEIFLQLIAWDPAHEVYHFYQRLGQAWAWAGHSWDAMAPDTRGKGPFDSHVNGAMVMKELKAPWIHWNSQASSITLDALAPTDPLRAEPLFLQRIGAEHLEQDVVRPGVRRWNDARFRSSFQGGVLRGAPAFFRQVLDTTTVNLASAPEDRTQVLPGRSIHLPLSFFFDDEALLNVLRLPAVLQKPKVDAAIYARCLQQHEVAIAERHFVFPGDTHFVFLVPERAFEDHVVLQKLIRLQLLPRKLAGALLMVDFSNPVFSARRASLLSHVPQEIRVVGETSELPTRMVASIQAGGAPAGSAEEEFLTYWNLADTDWAGALARRINDYMSHAHAALQSFDTFDPIFRLAESRRREFRRRPLFEFDLTTPITNIPADAPLLEMTPEATVRSK
jgi:hypothetical protein